MSENDIKPVALDRWNATGDYAFPAEEDAEGEFVCYDDAMEVIEALTKQISELKTMLSIAEFQRKEMQEERDEANRKLSVAVADGSALVADAERYRWLRDPKNSDAVSDAIQMYYDDAVLRGGEELDSHIDAARSEASDNG